MFISIGHNTTFFGSAFLASEVGFILDIYIILKVSIQHLKVFAENH